MRIVQVICLLGALQSAAFDIPYTLDRPATTSAGIFDSQGRPVKVLWTMQETAAGAHKASWDQTDAMGIALPAGEYHLRVAANRATYTNIGVIGNSGQPPSDKGHTPTNIESVAVDRDGNIYTANGWDEAGADFKKWDASGKSVYDAQFQIRNGRPNGAPYAIAVDDTYLYCAMGGWEREPWNNRQQIQRFRISDGKRIAFSGPSEKSSTDEPKRGEKPPRAFKGPADQLLDGHIQLYEWPGLNIPAGAPDAEVRLLKAPLRSLAVHGDTLYVADALGGMVRSFDKETGLARGAFAVKLPHAIAVDGKGQIWVASEQSRLRAFDGAGKVLIDVPAAGNISSIAVAPDGGIVVSDMDAGAVKRLDVTTTPPSFKQVLGSKAKSGDRAADRFYRLRGVAVDAQYHLVTIQREPGSSGARLARWSPEGKLLWEHFGTEFVSLGNYGVSDPHAFYSITHHRYRLLDRVKGTSDYLGNAIDLERFPTSDNTYRSDPHGVLRVLRIEKNDFVFMPTGDGVQVYRVDGPVLKLASLVGGADPDSTGGKHGKKKGKWSWSDTTGSGKPDPAAITPIDQGYSCFGMDVARNGTIIFANTTTRSIWTIPLGGVDARGNPTFDWKQAREAVARDTSPLGFEPSMAHLADDGSIYAFGWSKRWPRPANNPFWMGGNTFCRFDAQGKLIFAIPLPHTCVGFDTIPGGGGALVGRGTTGSVYHITADGLIIAEMKPGEAMNKQTGWFDNHACVAVSRDPRDGRLDVFTEDDFVCRIAWYRIDDRDVKTIEVPVK